MRTPPRLSCSVSGLDEVPEPQKLRRRLVDSILAFERSFPGCRYVVTSRIDPYRNQGWELPGFRVAELDQKRLVGRPEVEDLAGCSQEELRHTLEALACRDPPNKPAAGTVFESRRKYGGDLFASGLDADRAVARQGGEKATERGDREGGGGRRGENLEGGRAGAAKAPVEAVVQNPQDTAAQEALVAELRRVLAQDPSLAAQVQQWVGGHGAIIATGSAVAKDNGIAIGTVTFNR